MSRLFDVLGRMLMRRSQRLLFLFLTLALFLTAGVTCGPPTSAAPFFAPSDLALGRRVIVRLKAPPLALAGLATADPTAKLALNAPQAQDYLSGLEQTQSQVVAQIRRAVPGAVIERAYQVTFNGLAVRLPKEEATALQVLRNLSDVSAVYDEIAFQPALFSSVGAINVAALWSELGGTTNAGAGIKIAILDDGINQTHPMFADAGFVYPPGFPKGDARYTSRKVIAARIYVRPSHRPLPGEDTPTPGRFGSGHGTHVAGIAAGNPINAVFRGLQREIVGVAPRAWLMNYRIFYPFDMQGTEVAYTAEVLQAIEDAVRDGADVLCSSWSSTSPTLPFASPEAEAIEGAIAAGCVVVAAAGNQGPAPGSASRIPGGIERVISVGSLSKSQVVAYDVIDVVGTSDSRIQRKPFARALFGGQINALFGPFPYIDVNDADPANSRRACTPLPEGSLSGKIALIERGDCYFADKAYNVQRAGALAAVIYNDTDEITEMLCEGDHCAPGLVTIPTVMISRTVGLDCLAWAARHPGATLQLDPNGYVADVRPDLVQTSSARGPAYMRTLKPDVVAPGNLILSAYHDGNAPSGTIPFAQLSGTSMACAHVAGVAALLKQARPAWRHDEIKAALMTTARPDGLRIAGTSVLAGVLERGAGLVNASRAGHSSLFFSPPSLSVVSARPGQSITIPLALRDPDSTPGVTYQCAATSRGGITVNLPTQVTLNAAGMATINVNVSVSPNALPGEAQADLSFSVGDDVSHAPIWVHIVPAPSVADVLLIDNDLEFSIPGDLDRTYYLSETLRMIGVTYAYWDADALYGRTQSIPDLSELQKYQVVIWNTGGKRYPDGYFVLPTPLTLVDQQLLAAYLDGGGRLLAIGQNLAEASDVNPNPDPTWGRSSLYHDYLGVHWLQGNLYESAGGVPPSNRSGASGLPNTFLAGITLDLGSVGDGAHNQTSVDEIAPEGVPDGHDRDLVRPVLKGLEGRPQGEGYIGVVKADEATLENETPTCPYRTVYYAFGFEGINNNAGVSSRSEFLGRTLNWLLDTVTVALDELVVAPNVETVITCRASSSVGAPIGAYRWRVGEGLGAEIISSSDPFIRYTFTSAGQYPIAVEAKDALGHTALAHSTALAIEGGNSTLTAIPTNAVIGAEIAYQVQVRHTGPGTLALSFSLPLPEGMEYISHTGGAFADNVLNWSGTLNSGQTTTVELRVRVRRDVRVGSDIAAAAQFRVGSQTFLKRASVHINAQTFMPLILR